MNVLRPNFEKRGGLVIVTAQDFKTKEVLMQAYTDPAGYQETLETGFAVYYSTSRQKRWMKGEESGDVQKVRSIAIDCDGDSLIYFVEQVGSGACHTKARSCFYRSVVGTLQLMDAPHAGVKERLALMDVKVCERLLIDTAQKL